ncbi:hypothetical protein Fmac_032499 [Flemingia macrophylla]|uniref:mitogen-activated protein kinase kinase kinase n=1 Tax=Flemingia macrophylla TaxID=520843 RepID=A0ABD1L5J1_9FABA
MPLSRKPPSEQIHGDDRAAHFVPARQRNLRHQSHGGSDHRLFSAAPLPESPLTRRAKSISSTSVHACSLSSSPQHRHISSSGAAVHHDAVTCTKPTSKLDRRSLDSIHANSKCILRDNITAGNFLTGSTRRELETKEKVHQWRCSYVAYVNSGTISWNDDDSKRISPLNLGFAAKPKRTPTSVVTSPNTSPCKSSNVEFSDPTTSVPLEVRYKLKMLSAKTKTVHSPDHSFLNCPMSLTSYFNPKIEEESQHHKSLSRVCTENNLVDAHPLPLPPRVSPPVPLSVTMLQQSIAMYHADENLPSVKGQWQKRKLIGRGTFGSVFHATNKETGASCAMKEVNLIPDDPTSAECMKQLEQEIKVLRQLHHPNIVQYYGSEIVGNNLYIYMEYVYPGSISTFMREHFGAVTESVVRNFTRHILSGLVYLHSNNTIHRDIKGANLLVNVSGIVKLADFGLAKILTGNTYDLSLKGSPYWMAPEVVKGAIKDECNPDVVTAIDIWSLGCTVIEMLTGKPPWNELEGPSAMFKVLQESPPIPETLSSVGKDFLQQCFQRDPSDRPSAATLLKHAFVQKFHDREVIAHPKSYPRGDLGPEQYFRTKQCQ